VPSDLCVLRVSGLDVQRSIGLQWQEDVPAQSISILLSTIEKSLENGTAISH